MKTKEEENQTIISLGYYQNECPVYKEFKDLKSANKFIKKYLEVNSEDDYIHFELIIRKEQEVNKKC